MSKKRPKSIEDTQPIFRPANLPENQEANLINLAMQTAEQQLRDGTASSQVITHFLKLATEQTKLERVKTQKEIELLAQKKKAIEQEAQTEQMFKDAIAAMQTYAGDDIEDEHPTN